jgi:hypothetical protein
MFWEYLLLVVTEQIIGSFTEFTLRSHQDMDILKISSASEMVRIALAHHI